MELKHQVQYYKPEFQQSQSEQLLSSLLKQIQHSRDFEQLMSVIVAKTRELLQSDRVLVYQFAPDMSGTMVAEAVSEGTRTILGNQIEDTCFKTGPSAEKYRQGRKVAISNIYEADLSPCHRRLLEWFNVKAVSKWNFAI